MLSLKKLASLILILSLVAIFVLLYSLEQVSVAKIGIENDIPDAAVLMDGVLPNQANSNQILIVGDNSLCHSNICSILSFQKLAYTQLNYVTASQLDEADLVVFTDDLISEYVDLLALDGYINAGGKAIFASGLTENYTDSYLNPILGIVSKGAKDWYSDLVVVDGFFPMNVEMLHCDQGNASVWLSVTNKAQVYVSGEESNLPIVFSANYGDGTSMVINGSLLDDYNNIGIFTAAMATLLEDYLYPIVGVQLSFLDNCSDLAYYDNNTALRLYGVTADQFVADTVLPLFQSMGLRNDLKYTSGILVANTTNDSFTEATATRMHNMSKLMLQYGGEIVFFGNFEESAPVYYFDKLESYFSEYFSRYTVNGFAVNAPEMTVEIGEIIKNRYPGIAIVSVHGRSSAITPDTMFYKDDTFYRTPITSDNIDLESGTMTHILSSVTAYGYLAMEYNMMDIMGEMNEKDQWNQTVKDLATIEKQVYGELSWLTPVTLSQSTNYLESYLALDVIYEHTEQGLTIYCDQIQTGQPFLLRTEKDIVSMTGGSYTPINENYYMMQLSNVEAAVEFGK